MDLKARIIRADCGVIPSTDYVIMCVNGANAKGDVLTYCIHFQNTYPPSNTALTIYLCHADPAQQTHGGRPELRIYIEPKESFPPLKLTDGSTNSIFVPGAANGTCDLVYYSEYNSCPARLIQIYFVVEDCDTTLPAGYAGGRIDTVHAPGAGPKWQLGVDASGILHSIFPANWVPLEPVDLSQPSTTVPVEKRPQRHPAWFKFRSEMQAPPIPGLSGKLSGTKWYKMLGAYPNDKFGDASFAGNPLTRSGRILETPVTALYLAHLVKTRPAVVLHECGSFPHPVLADVMASPDGLIFDPARNFESLPGWFQTELNVEYAKDRRALQAIDFRRGIYECKTMATKDKKGNGPLFKEEHLAQLYAEMICTGTFWAEIVRFCGETKEMFVYRVYRKPSIARLFESVIVRMRKDLTEDGKTFAEAIAHPDNKTLLSECAKYAVYYNEPRTKDSRRTAVPYDEKVFAQVMQAMQEANGALSPTDPNAELIVSDEPVRKQSLTAAAKKKKAPAKPRAKKGSKRAPVEAVVVKEEEDKAQKRQKQFEGEPELVAAWEQIQATNKQIARAIDNGDWQPIQENNVLGIQSARFAVFCKSLTSVLTMTERSSESE